MRATRWVLITGEYPPTPGGVSDYSRQIAQGLAEAGDEVHVWAPADLRFASASSYPNVHRLPGAFGPRDLEILDRFLRRLPKPCRLLVQYVPHAFGFKGMNVPFCWWLSRRPEPVWIVFHEVVFPFSRDQRLTHNLLGLITHLMVSLVAHNAERIFVTIPSWQNLLPQSPSVQRRVTWLPVPSNIPTTGSPLVIREVREQIASAGEIIIGHFGTYGPAVTAMLNEVLPAVLQRDSRRRVLLIGRGSDQFALAFRQANPGLREQLSATGTLDREQIAAHLVACDCLVQPFIDGVSSRRTSVMAGLALGVPIVTNAGRLTDPVWMDCQAVALAPSPSPRHLSEAVENLLADEKRLSELRRQAVDFYQRNFALTRVIQTLRAGVNEHRLAS